MAATFPAVAATAAVAAKAPTPVAANATTPAMVPTVFNIFDIGPPSCFQG